MKTGLRLFISSGAFSSAIAVAYWYASGEPVGTVLLGIMAFAMLFVAGFMIVAEREARIVGDRSEATVAEAAGERVGVYAVRSALPLWLAVAASLVAVGILIAPPLAAIGVAGLLVLIAFMILQSR